MRQATWLRQSLLGAVLLACGAPASADALLLVCYNWGCQTQRAVSYSDPWLRHALQPLRQAKTPEAERSAVGEVVRRFYVRAAEQTPIGADAPGNDEDGDVNGRMDCIDHSTTTKNILTYLQQKKLLRWHEVGPYAHRTTLLLSHYSATLIETGMDASEDDQIYTFDPWDVAPGALPIMLPVREWAGSRFLTLETQHHTQRTSAY